MSEPGGAPRELSFSSRREGANEILVEVRDSGHGLRPRRWNGSSILSSPPSPTGWVWDSPSAARSWSPTVAASGRWRTSHGEPSSSSCFRQSSPIPIQKRELPIARWQAEEEDRSARRVFHRPQLSAVGFDDRAGDRESDAHPLGLRRVERLEHVLGGLSVEPLAGVLHIHDDLGSLERALVPLNSSLQFAPGVRIFYSSRAQQGCATPLRRVGACQPDRYAAGSSR